MTPADLALVEGIKLRQSIQLSKKICAECSFELLQWCFEATGSLSNCGSIRICSSHEPGSPDMQLRLGWTYDPRPGLLLFTTIAIQFQLVIRSN